MRKGLLSALLFIAACRGPHIPEDKEALFYLVSLRYYGPRYIFVGTGTPSLAIAYSVAFDGTLGETARITAGNFPVAFAFDNRLQYVHMGSNSGGGYISSLGFSRSTGQLSLVANPILGAAVATFDHPSAPYTINVIAGQINVYPINADGTLGTATAYDAGQTFAGGRMSPDGILYLANNAAAGSVRSYRVASSGIVTAYQTIPSGGITNQSSVGLHPSGRLLYVANGGASQIGIYTLDGGGGISGPAYTTIPGGAAGTSFAFDPEGRFLFASRAIASGNLQTFAVDRTTGALTFLTSTTVGSAPGAIAMDAAGRFLFVLDPPGNNIRVFTHSNGSLTQAPGSPKATTGATNPAALGLTMYEQYSFGTVDFN